MSHGKRSGGQSRIFECGSPSARDGREDKDTLQMELVHMDAKSQDKISRTKSPGHCPESAQEIWRPDLLSSPLELTFVMWPLGDIRVVKIKDFCDFVLMDRSASKRSLGIRVVNGQIRPFVWVRVVEKLFLAVIFQQLRWRTRFRQRRACSFYTGMTSPTRSRSWTWSPWHARARSKTTTKA